jgi:hypothetical protein
MEGLSIWAENLLTSRGALVESDEAGALRALLHPELASALGATEWLSLRFGAGAGSDDETEWLERLGHLLPSDARVVGARLRSHRPVRAIDSAAALDRELVINNGIYRLVDSYQTAARYYLFSFLYTIESDETSRGAWTVALNATARSIVPDAESLLRNVRDELDDDPAFVADKGELARLCSVALRVVEPLVRRQATSIENSANRRLARDMERVNSYYAGMLGQIGKRAARRSADPQAAAKERDRAAATERDRTAKLEDLQRKYALKIHIEPGDVVAVSLPVREISARVIRKKSERAAKFHWNPFLGALESPWCESCSGRAYPLHLCDDRVHFLCKSCLGPCAACGRQFCRACQAKCKCGAG